MKKEFEDWDDVKVKPKKESKSFKQKRIDPKEIDLHHLEDLEDEDEYYN